MRLMRNRMTMAVAIACLAAGGQGALATVNSVVMDLNQSIDPLLESGGLSARAKFLFDDSEPDKLTVELSNTSSGTPEGFDSASLLLTGLSFDLGEPGENPDDPRIVGGTAMLGPGGTSIHFDRVDTQLTTGDDVSGEWGFGNRGTTEMFPNFISTNRAGTTPFGGDNLDGPGNLNGPQGGIAPALPSMDLGGLGGLTGIVRFELTLNRYMPNLSYLDEATIRAEFGSDAFFVAPEPASGVPEPATLILLAAGSLLLVLQRRRQHLPFKTGAARAWVSPPRLAIESPSARRGAAQPAPQRL